MENLEHSTKIMKVAVLCSQVQLGNILGLQNQKMPFHAPIAASLQVRPGLRYATANNEHGAHVDQDSGKVSKHLKAFFLKLKLRLLHLHIVVPKYPHNSLSMF